MFLKQMFVAFVSGTILLTASIAYANAADDLMAALGMTAAAFVATQDQSDSSSATSTPTPTPTPVATTTPTESEQIAQLRALIVKLTAQLAELLKARAASTGATLGAKLKPGICSLDRQLSQGVDGEDVKVLQRFLVSEGLLDAGSVTGSYGLQTEKAVQKWQAQAGVIDHGEPYTTGFGRVTEETLQVMQAQCLTERQENRAAENEASALKDFFVKKVPMTLVMYAESADKTMELSYTVKETSQNPKMLRICSTLVNADGTALTQTDCWSLQSYGTHTQMMASDFGLVPLSRNSFVTGDNAVKLKLELFDPTQTSFDMASHNIITDSLGSDDTGIFDLYVGR